MPPVPLQPGPPPPSRSNHQAKTGSGASAVLLLLDLGSQRCYCANVGAAACLLSRISGSFNAKFPEGFFLSAEHTTRWVRGWVGGQGRDAR